MFKRNTSFTPNCISLFMYIFVYHSHNALGILQDEWPEGHKLASAMNFKFPQMVNNSFCYFLLTMPRDPNYIYVIFFYCF